MTDGAITDEQLAGIVATGSPLWERLAGGIEADPRPGDAHLVTGRLDTWRKVVADGDPGAFATRLEWDRLDLDRVRPLLGSVRLAPGQRLPAWSRTLADVVKTATALAADPVRRDWEFMDPADPIPFEEVLAPVVLVARDRLRTCVGRDLLTRQAHADLERHLLRTAAFVAAHTLHLEFSIQRAERQSGLARLLAQAQDEHSRAEYDMFVHRWRRELADLLPRYPVLARLLGRVVDQWAEATREFLERLAHDWADIRRAFGLSEDAPLVASIQPGLSDRHRGGRSVQALTLASGHRLVYKPKDIGIEHAFNRLLCRLNERGASPAFRVLTVLPRAGYGWVEFVTHAPCSKVEDGHRYYQRAGMLLSLVYALAGTDCHRDNLIASGDQPVLVDMECLLHHRPRPHGGPAGAWSLALAAMNDSVLGTGMLPSWEVDETDGGAERASDISALHTVDAQELVLHVLGWDHVNTDHMTLRRRAVEMPLPASQPTLGAVPLRLEDHAGDLQQGFSRFYRFLLEHRPALLARDGPLREIGQQRVRFIHRNTKAYGSLHQALRDPSYLRDGADRSILLEALASEMVRATSIHASRPRWWPLVVDEQAQMEQVDIPIFSARANEDTLWLSDGTPVEGCLLEPSVRLVIDRLMGLDEADLERQMGYIAGSLFGHVARDGQPTGTARHAPRATDRHGATRRQGRTDLERVARDAAAGIAGSAIRASDGSATWIAPQYLASVDRYQLQPIAYDINTGASGIALFLAALEHATGGAGYRDLVLGALEPVRRALREASAEAADAMGVGGATGLGSVIYAVTRVGQFLDEPDLLADAKLAALLLDDERIARAPADVFSGTAGAILGLLALHEAAADPAVLDRAIACGDHVLGARTATEGGQRAWATMNGRHLTGFSHGAAGIAFALLRLHAVTGGFKYLEAANEAISYERSIFDATVGNWPDLRVDEQPAYATSWCHGAPGIGLARVGGLAVLDTPVVRADIEFAIQATERAGIAGPDHLCCGNLGRGDLLLVAADRLGRPKLRDMALARARDVARRAEGTGSFTFHEGPFRDLSAPGFLQGLSGVGYQLLRVVHPDRMPSALLWL